MVESRLLESWRWCWRVGFAPQFGWGELSALAEALRENTSRLIQGATTDPPPICYVNDWPCVGACAVAFPGWQAGDAVEAVESNFHRRVIRADERLGGEGRESRHFLNWFDETPREEMRAALLAEVELALAEMFVSGGGPVAAHDLGGES